MIGNRVDMKGNCGILGIILKNNREKSMATAASILADLKSKGNEKTRAIYARHGMEVDKVLGVSTSDMKAIAKTIKGQQSLACELYATGIMEAMYLAGMVADGAKMTRKQLNDWARGAAGLQMIAEYTVPWVAVENAEGQELSLEWMLSKEEHIAAAGWCTYSGLVATRPDESLDLKEIEGLLATVVKKINGAENRVRYTMNGFVIAVGSHVKPLLKQAMAAARQLGAVSVNVGDTACKVPLAIEYIEKAEAAGKAGSKRKTIRC
jgi:3-methyladenine DNA glycosylase AlkD